MEAVASTPRPPRHPPHDQEKEDESMSIPKPRRAGQVGGGGRIGQTSNRGLSSSRGGRPHAGGGGSGRTPGGGNGCAVVATAMLLAPLLAVMGAVELVRWLS